MHQSPQKKLGNRRDKYAGFAADDEETPRQAHRESHGKARKFHLHEESPRGQRPQRSERG